MTSIHRVTIGSMDGLEINDEQDDSNDDEEDTTSPVSNRTSNILTPFSTKVDSIERPFSTDTLQLQNTDQWIHHRCKSTEPFSRLASKQASIDASISLFEENFKVY